MEYKSTFEDFEEVKEEVELVFNDLEQDSEIFENLSKEIFFLNPQAEYDYFLERMDTIETYSVDFFRDEAVLSLRNRYIRALASLKDDYESSALKDVYKDILVQLGLNDYVIEQEVANYKLTHRSGKQDIIVSKTGKSR